MTYTSPAPFSDSNGHDVSYAWLQLTLLSQCDSPLQQGEGEAYVLECFCEFISSISSRVNIIYFFVSYYLLSHLEILLTLCKSLNHSPISISHISRYVGEFLMLITGVKSPCMNILRSQFLWLSIQSVPYCWTVLPVAKRRIFSTKSTEDWRIIASKGRVCQ